MRAQVGRDASRAEPREVLDAGGRTTGRARPRANATPYSGLVEVARAERPVRIVQHRREVDVDARRRAVPGP